jgi:hypothetical protein
MVQKIIYVLSYYDDDIRGWVYGIILFSKVFIGIIIETEHIARVQERLEASIKAGR